MSEQHEKPTDRERIEWLLELIRADLNNLPLGELFALREAVARFQGPDPTLTFKEMLSKLEDPKWPFDGKFDPAHEYSGTVEELTENARSFLEPIQQRLLAGIGDLHTKGWWRVSPKQAKKRLLSVLELRADGTILTKDCPTGLALIRRRVRRLATAAAALVGMLFGGVALARISRDGNSGSTTYSSIGTVYQAPELCQRIRPTFGDG